ncbi:hypothetical protein ABE42_04015 [Bacillus thuringiensis]|uniref:Uncharacterized protein n=1 Tax=Bacillus thuringiensis TaxID=1428 RepID=A0A437SGB7_BACTU|nr:hypothetical protein [Bacillus thuringiensis]MBG9537552.1 hypothetical protein [Bacillus thuringiensis]MBG9578405.1 hypothetical protein [Bacillus thuringiensis]RVU62743.1 hypothetical protein BM74_19260 [Bacillus thuringiensis]
MSENKLTIKVNADTTEVLKQMKEITESDNECAAALEELGKVKGGSFNKDEQKDIQVSIVLGGMVTAESIVKMINKPDEIKRTF